jgi:hypothetical protein
MQEINIMMTNAECASLFALLANISNWIAKRRALLGRKEDFSFPVVLLLRDFAAYRLLASVYTRHALAWRRKDDWDDIFEWKRTELNHIIDLDRPLPK